MTELWLVRHGQTDWNLGGRWQGQSPHAPGLNDTGRRQALALREKLKGMRFAAIYASDLPRSFQTAELLAETLGMTVTPEPRLREINLGDWEGLLAGEIEARFPREIEERRRDPFHARAPNGESPCDVAERVLAAAGEIAQRHPRDSVLLVAHGLSLAIVICHAQGIPLEKVYEHIPENATPISVKWKQEEPPG